MSHDAAGEPAIIVFDGVCVLCSRSVQFVLRHDRAARFRFAPMQTASGARLMTAHGLDPSDPLSILLVDANGRAYTDSSAVIRIAVGFGGAWRACAIALAIPRRWRDAAYRALARRRYRWFGRRDTCLMPDPAMADRFLS
jgi:predicted DCC family thiol-disulfide oxidoreductase YuxK